MLVRTSLLIVALVVSAALFIRSQMNQQAIQPVTRVQGIEPSTTGASVMPAHATETSESQASSGSVQVDESALRYFAAQGDTRRLEAEIARLKALYPNWSPPTDLSAPSTAGDPELDRIWKLLSEGQLSAARSAIAARRAAQPNWQAPKDLLDKLELAEAARRLVNASDNRQWTTVLDIATQTPALLTCDHVDSLWRVAEAFAKTDKSERARDAYRYILTHCSNRGERIATIQKASELLSDADLNDLLKLERTESDGKGEFASIRADLVRTRIGRAAQDPKTTIPAEDLTFFERIALEGSSAEDALVVGYYHYSHGDPTRSLEWFKRSIDRKGGARANEGYTLALIALKRFAEAEEVAASWRSMTPANAKAYLTAVSALLTQMPPPRVEPLVLERATAAVNEARDATGAQALGWYAYNTGQVRTAASWFTTSLQWQPDHEPAAFGLALTRQRLRDRAGLRELVLKWRDRSERIADLLTERRPVLPDAPAAPQPRRVIVETSESEPRAATPVVTKGAWLERTTETVIRRSTAAPCGPISSPLQLRELAPGTALSQGWCLMRLKRPVEAAAAFEVAQQRGSDRIASEATYGRALALLEAGLTSEAAVAVTGGELSPQRRAEVTASLATQRALTAYRDGQYTKVLIHLDERARIVPEQNDLLMLRAWSYFHLGRYADAERIFKAVSKTAHSDEALRGLAVIRQRTGPFRE